MLGDLDEDRLLQGILPRLPGGPDVLVGPGDDAALLAVSTGAVLVTTDSMVRGRDWLDEWSAPEEVGRKLVAQNAADIAAMGGRTTALLVAVLADPQTRVGWLRGMTAGLADAAAAAQVAVIGGDLSSAPAGTLAVSVTALGVLDGPRVLRSGARDGDVVAVHGTLGHSAAGLLLLQRGTPGSGRAQVAWHTAPRPAYDEGPRAAAAGASAMLDVSDGLLRDASRIARASGVRLALESGLLRDDMAELAPLVGEEDARECVLTGGEEHSLLACFPADRQPPPGWRPVGRVRTGQGVTVDGRAREGGGWDHFDGSAPA